MDKLYPSLYILAAINKAETRSVKRIAIAPTIMRVKIRLDYFPILENQKLRLFDMGIRSAPR